MFEKVKRFIIEVRSIEVYDSTVSAKEQNWGIAAEAVDVSRHLSSAELAEVIAAARQKVAEILVR